MASIELRKVHRISLVRSTRYDGVAESSVTLLTESMRVSES
jgi:hypothetical protein